MNRVFRPNVAALVRIGDRYVCCERAEPRGVWQTVQGGVEEADASPEAALLREMSEELGVAPDAVRIVARSRCWRRYEFPPEVRLKHPERPNIGQEQLWFLVELSDLRSIDLNRAEGEFVRVELVELEQLLSQIVAWKLPIVKDFCYELGMLSPLSSEMR